MKELINLLKSYSTLTSADPAALNDPAAEADRIFFDNNQPKIEQNLSGGDDYPSKSQLGMILANYTGKDEHGVYFIIKGDKEARNDFDNNPHKTHWNRWSNLNNLGTTINSLLNPAGFQNPKNQEGKTPYFQINEIRKDVLEIPYEHLNLTEKIFRYNYDNQEKLEIFVRKNPDVVDKDSKWYLPSDLADEMKDVAEYLGKIFELSPADVNSDSLNYYKDRFYDLEFDFRELSERNRTIADERDKYADSLQITRLRYTKIRKNYADEQKKNRDFLSNMRLEAGFGINNKSQYSINVDIGLPTGQELGAVFYPKGMNDPNLESAIFRKEVPTFQDLTAVSESRWGRDKDKIDMGAYIAQKIAGPLKLGVEAGTRNLVRNSLTYFETGAGDSLATDRNSFKEQKITVGPVLKLDFDYGSIKFNGQFAKGLKPEFNVQGNVNFNIFYHTRKK